MLYYITTNEMLHRRKKELCHKGGSGYWLLAKELLNAFQNRIFGRIFGSEKCAAVW